MKEISNKILIMLLFLFVIILLILIIVNKNYLYKEKNTQHDTEVSTEPIEENQIKTIDNQLVNQKPIDSNVTDWNLILVNKDNAIPEDYKVEVIKVEEKWNVDTRIKESLEQMLSAARKEGLDPVICSAYRSTEYQTTLFNKKVMEYKRKGLLQESAEQQASYWVTNPRTSEHEIGLALDIVERKYQVLDERQENTAVQKWLMEHCYEYGFILRYPTDKKEITKINYEPWHYRYVGVKDAMFIKEKGFCLEEYIEFLKEYE